MDSLVRIRTNIDHKKEHIILIGKRNGQYTAYLTGLSKYIAMKAKADTGNFDMANIASVTEKLYTALETIAPKYQEMSFQTSVITKLMLIRRMVNKNSCSLPLH